MFKKLRQARYLKARSNTNSISVGFFDRVDRLSWVHQYGLRDRVRPGGTQVQYARRQLLGFTAEDEAVIEAVLVEWLGWTGWTGWLGWLGWLLKALARPPRLVKNDRKRAVYSYK